MIGNIQDQVANETTSFSYDQSYRLSSISNPRGTISYTYTVTDQVQSYQVNSDPPVALSYYDDGSVKNITRSGDSPLVYYYLLSGQRAQVLYPNNARVDYAYDDQGRLTSIINRKPDASVLSSYSYGYDYNYTTGSYTMKGFRTSVTNHLAQMEKYYFDNLYQLNRVDYPNGDIHQWTYDDIGNRVQQVVIPSGQPPVVTNYTYYQNSQSWNSQLLQSDGLATYTWDNNGNLSAKGATNYAWDYDDRLTGISGPLTSASYVYDFQGNRIKKTVSGVETAYLYLSEDIVKETSGGITTNYLHGIGIDEPVMMDRAGAKSYYFSDGLGSIREMMDAVGTVQNSYTYGAWGELRAQNVAVPNSYGYTGREFAEDGLYFYRARYLDPGLGRFVSEDPIGIYGGLNFYLYVYNTPFAFTDPFGLMEKYEDDPLMKSMTVINEICCAWHWQFEPKKGRPGGDRELVETAFFVEKDLRGEDLKIICGKEVAFKEHQTAMKFRKLTPGYHLVGYFHTHPPGDLSTFSGKDIQIYKDYYVPVYSIHEDVIRKYYQGKEERVTQTSLFTGKWCLGKENRARWEETCCPQEMRR